MCFRIITLWVTIHVFHKTIQFPGSVPVPFALIILRTPSFLIVTSVHGILSPLMSCVNPALIKSAILSCACQVAVHCYFSSPYEHYLVNLFQ